MSGDSGETDRIVLESETVSENNANQSEKKEKSLPLPVLQQNTKEKTSNMKNSSKKASTPKKPPSSKKPPTSTKASSSSELRGTNLKEKHHDSHTYRIESINERMHNSPNRYNKNSKYNDSRFQNLYAVHTNDKHYSHNYRTGKQYYNNRSYVWNSYSNSPQNYNFNYRPRHYFYSHDKYNASHENEFSLNNEHTYFNHYNNYGESSNSGSLEENFEDLNMNDSKKLKTSYSNPFLSNLPSSENPFRKLYSEDDVSSPKSSKERLGAEASVSNSDERAVSSTSSPRKRVIISKLGEKRTIIRSRSLSASESDRKRKDKTDQAESEESEEQRIQDWTNSLLENNHNQITRLVNPSNNKEKAAVNHLITKFSKSKRKEILTRTLRTNSSELTDNDDRDVICEGITAEGESANIEDEEISIILDSKITNSNLEESDINLCSPSTSKTVNSENSECNGTNKDKKRETVLESSKSSFNQKSKMYKKYEKLKDNNFTSSRSSNKSSHNSNSNLRYKEKYVKRKSDGSDAKVKKKQKTTSVRNITYVNTNESEDLNTDNSRKTMTPENTFCSPSSAKTSNQDLSASDIKEEVIETTGENVADSSSTTHNEKKSEENLVFSPDVSVDTLIQLFASGSVRVKEEFNDPVMDVLKEINPDELINACSNNSLNSCEETVNKNNTSSPNWINSKDKSSLETSMDTVHMNKGGMDPVILGSAAIERNVSSGSVPAKNCALNENTGSSVATEPTSSTSDRSELHNHSFPCTDNDKNSDNSLLNFNEISNAKVELPPYLNKLIKQLQDITSEEEKVKENLIEAKSKISMYASLLEEWKTKKKVLNEEEESLRKQRNNIIKLMQNAVKTDSDHDEKESNSSSLKDDRLGDHSTCKKKLEEVNSAEIVNASRTSRTSPSSFAEKQQKQVKTVSSPGSPESDEIIIVSPPQKPKPPEIIICDDEENTSIGNRAKVSSLEMNSSMPSNKSPTIYDLRTVDAHTTVINSLVVFEDFLYTCSNDNTAKRYSLKSATPCVTYQHSAKNVTEIVVEKVQNEALVFTSCSARLISLFIAASGTKIKNFFPPCAVMSICKGWGKFYAGLANGSVNVYNWKYEEIELVKTEHPASRIATAHQGRLHVLVILSSEGNIAIRDAETGLLIRYIKINIKHPSWMCLHSDLAYLSSADKILIVLDVMSGKIEKKLHMNSHTTGLAVYDDFIFTISYNGIINCYNKDKSNDKRLFYGIGKAGLTCIHVYNNWVFTGNRKGDVSLFHFDPSSLAACEFAKCDVVYGLKEDLEYHIEKDHLQKKKMLTQCNWRGCNFKFPRGADLVDKMNHLKTHIYQMDFAPTFLVSCQYDGV